MERARTPIATNACTESKVMRTLLGVFGYATPFLRGIFVWSARMAGTDVMSSEDPDIYGLERTAVRFGGNHCQANVKRGSSDCFARRRMRCDRMP